MDTKAKEAAEKAAKEKAELEAKEAAEKAAKEKAELEAKEAAEKAAKEKKFKKEYRVCVTGFMALGKMFRANQKISSKIYKDYIEKWLEKGYIK